jgi:hypothetical protein
MTIEGISFIETTVSETGLKLFATLFGHMKTNRGVDVFGSPPQTILLVPLPFSCTLYGWQGPLYFTSGTGYLLLDIVDGVLPETELTLWDRLVGQVRSCMGRQYDERFLPGVFQALMNSPTQKTTTEYNKMTNEPKRQANISRACSALLLLLAVRSTYFAHGQAGTPR